MSIPPPIPAAETCPNCHQSWPEGAAVCPNCGYVRPASAAWPPPPAGQAAVPQPPPSRLVTKSAAGDILLGLGVSVLTLLVGLGFVALPVLYFVLRRQYPNFARGLGYGWLVGTVLVLGALAVCVYAFAHSSPNGAGT